MKRIQLALALVAALTTSIAAHGFKIAEIEITHPFVNATLPGAKTAAGYMILTNHGTEPERLLRIETKAAAAVQFHRTVVEDGIAKMRPIQGGIEIPAGGEFRVGADGSHAMLVGLTAPIGLGELIDATLVFEHSGPLEMTFEVEPVGTKLAGAEETHDH